MMEILGAEQKIAIPILSVVRCDGKRRWRRSKRKGGMGGLYPTPIASACSIMVGGRVRMVRSFLHFKLRTS
jgi:hypothetical protein